MTDYEKPRLPEAATDNDEEWSVVFFYKLLRQNGEAQKVAHVRVGDHEYPLSQIGYTAPEKAQLKALIVKAIQYCLGDQGFTAV